MDLWNWKRSSEPPAQISGNPQPEDSEPHLLSAQPPGTTTRLLGYLPGMPPKRRAQLQAYGLLPGQTLRVIQHNPVTIIQVELTELALETELARSVVVE